jgi:hypothetical protein
MFGYQQPGSGPGFDEYGCDQSLVLNNQDLDKGLMTKEANHCGELHLGRPSFVGGKGGEGGVGLMENIFYSKLNQIYSMFGYQKPGREYGFDEYGCESLR